MTVKTGELAADRVRLRTLRHSLGAHLATYRTAAGISQPELAQALSRTRSTISKVEHGTRGMPGRLQPADRADEDRGDGVPVPMA